MSSGTVILGAGGHGKVALATAQAAGHLVSAVYDDDARHWGTSILGIRVEGPFEKIPVGVPAVVAVGSNAIRARLAGIYDLDWQTLVHPRAFVHSSAKLGPGTVVFAGAVVQPDAQIGCHAVINTCASVDHDAHMGDFSFLGPGARLAGAASIEEGAFLGINAAVLPGRAVGAWAIVGAGATVIEDIPPRATAVGVPARILGPNQ